MPVELKLHSRQGRVAVRGPKERKGEERRVAVRGPEVRMGDERGDGAETNDCQLS